MKKLACLFVALASLGLVGCNSDAAWKTKEMVPHESDAIAMLIVASFAAMIGLVFYYRLNMRKIVCVFAGCVRSDAPMVINPGRMIRLSFVAIALTAFAISPRSGIFHPMAKCPCGRSSPCYEGSPCMGQNESSGCNMMHEE